MTACTLHLMRQNNNWLAASGHSFFFHGSGIRFHVVPSKQVEAQRLRGQVMVFAALWTRDDKAADANAYVVFTMNLKFCAASTRQFKKYVQVLFLLVHILPFIS